MRALKSAYMVAPYSFTLRTTAGHTIRFEKDKKVHVPSVVVNDARKHGAKIVEQTGLGQGLNEDMVESKAKIRVDHEINDEENLEYDDEILASESIHSEADVDDAPDQEPPEPSFIRYSEREMRIKKAIQKIIGYVRSGEDVNDYFASSNGFPKITKIQEHVPGGERVTARERDAVFQKMLEEGSANIPSETSDIGE